MEIEGKETLVASCNTMAEEGMVIHTSSLKAHYARRMNLQIILSQHDFRCAACQRNGSGAASFTNWTRRTGFGTPMRTLPSAPFTASAWDPFSHKAHERLPVRRNKQGGFLLRGIGRTAFC